MGRVSYSANTAHVQFSPFYHLLPLTSFALFVLHFLHYSSNYCFFPLLTIKKQVSLGTRLAQSSLAPVRTLIGFYAFFPRPGDRLGSEQRAQRTTSVRLTSFFYAHVSWSSLNHCFITPNHKLSDQYHLCKRSKLDSSLWWHSVAVPYLI